MFFSRLFGSKKPALKLKSGQEVEIEFFSEDTGFEAHFTKILDINRKKIIVQAPGTERRPIRMLPGQQVTVTTLDGNTLFSFDSKVLDAGEREFDISSPTDTKEEVLPEFNDTCSIEVPVTVEYRAMNSAHNQVAQTYSISPLGLVLATNIPIPSGTNLHLEIEIPGAPDFSTKGCASGSRSHPSAKSKHLCEIEYIDIARTDAMAVVRYAVYARRRLQRKNEREAAQ